MDWRPGTNYEVGVPAVPTEFFRMVTDEQVDQDAGFLPDSDVKSRASGEDHCSYRGISVWETEGQARDRMELVNARRVGRVTTPPLAHVVKITLRPKRRHACARTGPEEGHHNVWAPPDELRSSSALVLPNNLDKD
jgi:hypothetical protein